MAKIEDSFGEFDEQDLALLEYIEQDFDVSLEHLADKLDLSKSAVHYRLQKLRENGVIEGVRAELNPLAFDLDMLMITDVIVSHESGYADEIGGQLADIKGVSQVYYTMGDIDFVVISRAQNREQMNDILDIIVSIPGVNETSSRFVMKEMSTGRHILEGITDDMRRNILATK